MFLLLLLSQLLHLTLTVSKHKDIFFLVYILSGYELVMLYLHFQYNAPVIKAQLKLPELHTTQDVCRLFPM